jgi:hypothetical protein
MVRTTQILKELLFVGEPWRRAFGNASPSLNYGFDHGVRADLQEPLIEERSIAMSVVGIHSTTLPIGCACERGQTRSRRFCRAHFGGFHGAP